MMTPRCVSMSSLRSLRQRLPHHHAAIIKSVAVSSTSGGLDAALLRRMSSPVIRMDDDEAVSTSDHATTTTTTRETSTARTNTSSSSPKPRPIFVAATRQHVGKTSVSLALLSGLQERFAPLPVAFMKPVGQQYLPVEQGGQTYLVDKDVALVQQHFNMSHCNLRDMSPVLIPSGYTKDYLNGKIHDQDQRHAIQSAYNQLAQNSSVVLCEGTGHVAVGSIVGAGNAQVASWLGADMVLVANGGIGQCFDDLELNRRVCEAHNVRIAGIIVNKVQPAKYEQTLHFLNKALEHHWNDVPLLGCIPDRPYLGCPALKDLETLLDAQPLHPTSDDLCAVHGLRLRHYRELFLVATSLEVFLKNVRSLPSRTLFVCHASRHDILLGFMGEYQRRHRRARGEETTTDNDSDSTMPSEPVAKEHIPPHSRYEEDEIEDWQAALVVCGTDTHPLSPQLQEILCSPSPRLAHLPPPPILVTKHSMDKVMQMFYSYTPKLNVEDSNRVQTAVDHYKPHIDFDLLMERTGYNVQQQTETV